MGKNQNFECRFYFEFGSTINFINYNVKCQNYCIVKQYNNRNQSLYFIK